MEGSLQDVANELLSLKQTDSLLVVTGAGVSAASGIPTFRGSDPDAVWARDTTQMGTHRYFVDDPAGSPSWCLSRFEKVVGARFRCSREGCNLGAPAGSIPRSEVDLGAFLAAPSLATVPRCPACSSLLRQHVLWFDERYDMHADYQIERALRAAKRARVVIFAGTSFAVGITAMGLEEALGNSAGVYTIDPTPRPSAEGVRTITAPAEVALPALRDTRTARSS